MIRFAFLALALCVACGPMNQSSPIQGLAQGLIGGGGAESDTPDTGGVMSLTRAFVEAQPNDLLLASVISREATAILVRGGNNGSKTTWLSPDGISVTLDRGLVVATRGLGDDMMGAEVSAVLNSFGRQGSYPRRYSFLNGLDQIEMLDFQCQISLDRSETITIVERAYATNVFIETCDSREGSIRNLYWRASNGVIWQSRQWISAEVGYLGYQRL